MIQISPSLLAADFSDLKTDIKKIECNADWLHLDIMDGSFVPNISFGIPVVKAVRKCTQLPLDVHLMINNPEHYIEPFCQAGADLITVHAEATMHLHRTLTYIKSLGCKAGIALNPHSSPECLRYVLNELDMILVMSVNPGFGGQSFIDTSISKIAAIADMISKEGIVKEPIIAVDGGINISNISKVAKVGASYFVAGSAVFKADSPALAIEQLKQQV